MILEWEAFSPMEKGMIRFRNVKIVILAVSLSLLASSCSFYADYKYNKSKRLNGQLTCIGAYISEYRETTGSFPTDLADVFPIPESSDRFSLLRYCYGWRPEETMQPDPWGEPFMYWSDGDNYVVWSKGADRQTDAIWLEGVNENWCQDTVVANGRSVLVMLEAALPLIDFEEPYDVVVEKFPALAAAARKAHGIVDPKPEE